MVNETWLPAEQVTAADPNLTFTRAEYVPIPLGTFRELRCTTSDHGRNILMIVPIDPFLFSPDSATGSSGVTGVFLHGTSTGSVLVYSSPRLRIGLSRDPSIQNLEAGRSRPNRGQARHSVAMEDTLVDSDRFKPRELRMMEAGGLIPEITIIPVSRPRHHV